MVAAFSPIFVADTKIICNYNFVAPLNSTCSKDGKQKQTSYSPLLSRSSHPGVFCKKGALKILQNSQENNCFRPKTCNFIKKETPTKLLSC